MKIFKEKDGCEFFLDILLSDKEICRLTEYSVISAYSHVNGEEINIGIKLELEGHEDENI